MEKYYTENAAFLAKIGQITDQIKCEKLLLNLGITDKTQQDNIISAYQKQKFNIPQPIPSNRNTTTTIIQNNRSIKSKF